MKRSLWNKITNNDRIEELQNQIKICEKHEKQIERIRKIIGIVYTESSICENIEQNRRDINDLKSDVKNNHIKAEWNQSFMTERFSLLLKYLGIKYVPESSETINKEAHLEQI